MLKILHLKITNFKRHKRAEFHFSDGMTSIIGKNGSGKSSIIDAIGLSLFNTSFISMKDLISYGEQSATIIVDFVFNKKVYKIERVIGNKSKVELVDEDGNVYNQSKVVYDYLTALFGFDLNSVYKNILCINTSNITSLLLLEPSKRKSVFDSIFGLDYFEDAWKNLRLVEQQIEGGLNQHNTNLDITKASYKSAKEDSDNVNSLVIELNRLNELQKDYINHQVAINKLDMLRNNKSSLHRTIGSIEKRINELSAKKVSLKPNKCPTCGGDIEQEKFESYLSNIDSETDKLQTDLFSYKSQLDGLSVEESMLSSTTYTDYSNSIKGVENKLSIAMYNKDKLDGYNNKIQELILVTNKLKNKLDKLKFIRSNVKTIPTFMMNNLCARVNKESTRMLSEIMDEPVLVNMTGDYGISVEIKGSKLEFHQLSDGQKVMTAISIRFAIINALTNNIGFAVLDEPTVNLDENHRTRLAHNISKIRLGQVFVITHDDSFNDGYVINL